MTRLLPLLALALTACAEMTPARRASLQRALAPNPTRPPPTVVYAPAYYPVQAPVVQATTTCVDLGSGYVSCRSVAR